MPTPERNAPCPCGSGKKYKQCCMHKHKQERVETILPLRIRKISPVSSSSSQSLPIALPAPSHAEPAKPEKEENSTLQNPTHPSYDSLMERVFGTACTETKAHLQGQGKELGQGKEPEKPEKPEKEKETSATLEEANKNDTTS